MSEEKKITSLDELDAKMAEQKERMKEKSEQVQQPPPDQVRHTPWTDKMQDSFRQELVKSQKCMACKNQNFGQYIIILNHIQVMRESLPLPTLVCSRCGTLFIPKWARRIANQAIEQENKIVKQMSPPGDE
jgi:hypothetical protein